ncbi:hypothetical protein EYF80_005310 [Liparis tanakae]|uniref:Uncharacterized protein n=1 Tax=Liparis tanakae TaxID=230148 RepID=A0A4Z2J2T5_9TELE|nr:hypothetical protein EYF80_005310 [Liparis tanakae]
MTLIPRSAISIYRLIFGSTVGTPPCRAILIAIPPSHRMAKSIQRLGLMGDEAGMFLAGVQRMKGIVEVGNLSVGKQSLAAVLMADFEACCLRSFDDSCSTAFSSLSRPALVTPWAGLGRTRWGMPGELYICAGVSTIISLIHAAKIYCQTPLNVTLIVTSISHGGQLSPSLANLERTVVVKDVVKLPFVVPELHEMLYLIQDRQAKMAAACHLHQWISQMAYASGFVLANHWGRPGGWDL